MSLLTKKFIPVFFINFTLIILTHLPLGYSQEITKQYSVFIIHKPPMGDQVAADGWLACMGLVLEHIDLRNQLNDSCKTQLDVALRKAGYQVKTVSLKEDQEEQDITKDLIYDVRISEWQNVYEHTKYSYSSPLEMDITLNYEVLIVKTNKKNRIVKKIHHEEPSTFGFGNREASKSAQKKTAEELLKHEMEVIQEIINWLNENLGEGA